jgi:hypothetical protein
MRAIKKDNYILILLLTAFTIFIAFIITIAIYTQNSFRLACINNGGELYVSNWVYFCE